MAEELRKDGELEEAIRVARDGLQRHPNYPSARMTLGRAYQDTGEWARARVEYEQALKGAPDNILASRSLAECLEQLGETAGALARYKSTLLLAPGDKQVMAHIAALETKSGVGTGPVPSIRPAGTPGQKVAEPPLPPPPSPAPVSALPAAEEPIPLVAVDTPMELEGPHVAGGGFASTPAGPPPAPLAPLPEAPPGGVSRSEPPPIPVSAVEEEFELERPYEAPRTAWSPEFTAPAPARPAAVVDVLPVEPMTEFDFEATPPAPPAPPVVSVVAPEAEVEAVLEPEPAPVVAAEPPDPIEPAPATPDLTSPTLAELYFNQGFTDKAIQVYHQLLERDPGNSRFQARVKELEAVARHLGESTPPTPSTPPPTGERGEAPAPPADRRQVLERTIARLEGFLAAIRRE